MKSESASEEGTDEMDVGTVTATGGMVALGN